MPITNGVGWSESTGDKEAGLAELLGLHMQLCQAITTKNQWADKTYYWLDITAGSGDNPEARCYGSPLVFIQQAKATRLRYRAAFIEKDSTNALRLAHHLWPYPGNHLVLNCDHEAVLVELVQRIPQKTYGMIYADPNGEPPFELLSEVSRLSQCKRLDILIYASGTTIKRKRGAHNGRSLVEYMGGIDKSHWLVRDHKSKHQWTFLLGTNWPDYPGLNKIDFHSTASDKGMRILAELNLTEQERKAQKQMTLPYANYDEYLQHPQYRAVRAQAVERSGGRCERCDGRPMTEVHHLQYPAWGTFDTVDNLLAICHECHCEIHGKED